MKRTFSIILINLASLVCSGCISTLPIEFGFSDLVLIEVPEVTGNEIDRGRYIERQGYIPRLRLDVASKENILDFAKREGVGISANIFFCESPNRNVLINRSDILFDGVSLNAIRLMDAPIDSLQPNESGEFIYSVVLGLFSPEVEGGSIKMDHFDLVTAPRDICLVVELKSKLRGFETETLRIPKEVIRQATYLIEVL